MNSTGPATALSLPDHDTILEVIRLATRAPSVHNTQPWHWILDSAQLYLYADRDRMLPAADPRGRQRVISCGAVLHHARSGFAAKGWHTDTVRLPDPSQPDHLATIKFWPWPEPPDAIRARAEAIGRRYTDRLPMLEPEHFERLLPALRRLATPHLLEFDVLRDEARSQLAAISELATTARRDDMMYQQELQWWAGHSGTPEGVPPTALTSDAESARVDVGRRFPAAPHSMRRAELTDHSRVTVLSSDGDSPLQWLRTGEALSAILLECTANGLATCAVTHITELPTGRRALAALLPHPGVPQAVIRIGSAPEEPAPTPTPRRPLADVLEIRRG
jgi:nitroreductase